MTKQHTAYRQSDPFEAFKQAVVEFTNAVGTPMAAMEDIKSEPMQLGKLTRAPLMRVWMIPFGSRRTFGRLKVEIMSHLRRQRTFRAGVSNER